MRATLRGALLPAREGHICVRGALPRRYNHLVMPISRFAAGPVKDATKRTTRSPSVQPWWRAMVSNWIIHGRNCADTVPSNVGTLGLEDGCDIELLIPLWYELRCASLLSPLSSSCVGRS